jgi:UDP-glucose:(heptosyl)LPS alpha-1,3-glucosyltransferase
MSVQLPHRPRLVLVAHGIHDDGGMERAFAELIRRMHDRYEIVVVSADLGGDLRGLVEWHRVRIPGRPAALRFAVFYVLAAARLAVTRADIVHALGAIVPNRVDVVSVHFCNAGFVEAVGRLSPPNAPAVRRLNTGAVRVLGLLAERWSYRPGRVRRLATVSRGVADELERHYAGVPVTVTPNGVDRDRFQPDPEARRTVRGSLGFGEDDVVALFVGGDWDTKGLGLAIEAVAAAARRLPSPVRLVVVGRGDEERFQRLADGVGLGERLTFMGMRRDAERFYAAADVFVLPSWYETFSLAAHEAAASGLAIVAPRVNGIEELLADGGGIVVDRTVEHVGDVLAQIAQAPHLRRSLGATARERSAAFTWERSAGAVAEVYLSLVEPAPPTRLRAGVGT